MSQEQAIQESHRCCCRCWLQQSSWSASDACSPRRCLGLSSATSMESPSTATPPRPRASWAGSPSTPATSMRASWKLARRARWFTEQLSKPCGTQAHVVGSGPGLADQPAAADHVHQVHLTVSLEAWHAHQTRNIQVSCAEACHASWHCGTESKPTVLLCNVAIWHGTGGICIGPGKPTALYLQQCRQSQEIFGDCDY